MVASPQAAQINLLLQILIVALLTLSIVCKRRGRLFRHGVLMLLGVVLNFVSFFALMAPSLLSLEIVRTQPLHQYSLIALTHAIVGIVSLFAGAALVGLWHLQPKATSCAGKGRIMRTTLVLWVAALLLGIWFYFILNGA